MSEFVIHAAPDMDAMRHARTKALRNIGKTGLDAEFCPKGGGPRGADQNHGQKVSWACSQHPFLLFPSAAAQASSRLLAGKMPALRPEREPALLGPRHPPKIRV